MTGGRPPSNPWLVSAALLASVVLACASCSDDTGTGVSGDSGEDNRPTRDLGEPQDTQSDLAADSDTGPTDLDDERWDAATDAPSDPAEDGAADLPDDGASQDGAGSDPDGGGDLGDAVPDGVDDPSVDPPGDSADSSTDGATDGAGDPAGDAAVDAEPDVPWVTPPPGSYQYGRVPLGGLSEVVAVAIHPTEPVALLLESRDEVHRWNWELGTDTQLDPVPGTRHVDWQEVAFAPDGETALLLGSEPVTAGRVGVIYRFDEAAWPAEGVPTAEEVFSEYAGLPAAHAYSALDWSDGGLPMVVSYNDLGSGNYTVALRRFDPQTGDMTFFASSASTGACVDIANTENAFGEPGWLLTCNLSVLYATEVGLPPAVSIEWTTDLGGFNTGNANHVAAHRSHEYALLVGWSGRRVFRFDHEVMPSSATAPWFTTRDIWGVEFQPDGRRAVIFGGQMNISGSIIGSVLEYRHDLYAFADFTDVSIPNFGSPPFVADNNFNFDDAAWRRDCDGGLLVGGESDFSGSTGMLVTFEIEGGEPCW